MEVRKWRVRQSLKRKEMNRLLEVCGEGERKGHTARHKETNVAKEGKGKERNKGVEVCGEGQEKRAWGGRGRAGVTVVLMSYSPSKSR